MGANLRLKRPASRTRVLSRVALLDVAWGGASPLLGFLLRDGAINSPAAVAFYCAVALLASLLVFQWFRTSSPIFRYFSIKDALDLFKACVVIAALSAVATFLFSRLNEAPRSIPVLHLILLTSGLLTLRLYARLRDTRREARAQATTNSVQHVLIIQASRLAWFFSKMLEELAPGKYQIVAILDERPELQHRSLNGYPIVGTPAHVETVVDEYAQHGIRIDKIIAAAKPEAISAAAWRDIARVCHTHEIQLEILPDRLMAGLSGETIDASAEPRTTAAAIAPSSSLDTLLGRPFWKIKRVIDFTVALSVAIVTCPVTCLVFGLALLDVGTPAIFWQQRAGRNGKALHLYKFRTLQTLFDRHTKQRREAEQPSVIGRFLRKTRLDELPQLWNVLRGDMSLIGPRPLLPIDQPHDPALRLAVRPGISGWAQICGGKLITPEEKTALDEWYIRHGSLSLDARIILRTLIMLAIGDRRDEQAISTALAEKYEGELAKLSSSVATPLGEQRSALRQRSEAARVADARSPIREARALPGTSADASARSVAGL